MERLGSFFENMNAKRAAYAIGGVLGTTLLLFMLLAGGSDKTIDSYPLEGSDQDYSSRVRLIGGDELFKQLKGDRRYDSISEDLYVFATTAYSVYKQGSTDVIGFKLSGKSKIEGESITFSGKYGSSDNKVEVKVTMLNNDRITSAIRDTKTDLSIDSKLPSNSKINKYISELPKVEPTYSAEYVRSSGNISVFLNTRDPNLLPTVLSDLEAYMDDGSYDRKRIEVLFPTESIGL